MSESSAAAPALWRHPEFRRAARAPHGDVLQRGPEGLRCAPLAALVAVVAPEIVMAQGHVSTTWEDASLYGAGAATGWHLWRRNMFGTIIAGTAVLPALRLTLGW